MATYRLGIDVGGTNTDAVILDQKNTVLKAVKKHTTNDIESGIFNAMDAILSDGDIDLDDIKYAMLGTTQCTNAIVERKHLVRVGLIRLGYPATCAVPPYTEWSEDLIDNVNGKYRIAHGGYEYNGDSISDIDEEEIETTLKSWVGSVDSIAIVGVFSSVRQDQENKVAQIARNVFGDDTSISLSCNIGSLGLIQRENATILNAALNQVIKNTTQGFVKALERKGIKKAEAYLCQNDGTLMSTEYAEKYPILTIGSGPTNSIRGAEYLGNAKNAMILDIGGTTSDIGVLSNGLPRESSAAVQIGGVKTNFRMPDINSIGIGGGSIVHIDGDNVTVGPDSVGYKITDKALCFGGDVITATDIADRLDRAQIGDPELTNKIPLDIAEKALDYIKKQLEQAIDQMKTSADDIKVILVGGGAPIAPDILQGVSEVITDSNGGVANAIGATIAQVSGEFEQIFTYDTVERSKALDEAKTMATNQALKAGAQEGTIETVEINEIPLAYAPGNANNVRLKVIGKLK